MAKDATTPADERDYQRRKSQLVRADKALFIFFSLLFHVRWRLRVSAMLNGIILASGDFFSMRVFSLFMLTLAALLSSGGDKRSQFFESRRYTSATQKMFFYSVNTNFRFKFVLIAEQFVQTIAIASLLLQSTFCSLSSRHVVAGKPLA